MTEESTPKISISKALKNPGDLAKMVNDQDVLVGHASWDEELVITSASRASARTAATQLLAEMVLGLYRRDKKLYKKLLREQLRWLCELDKEERKRTLSEIHAEIFLGATAGEEFGVLGEVLAKWELMASE